MTKDDADGDEDPRREDEWGRSVKVRELAGTVFDDHEEVHDEDANVEDKHEKTVALQLLPKMEISELDSEVKNSRKTRIHSTSSFFFCLVKSGFQ